MKKQNLIKALPSFNRVQCPSGVALFLDIDGTLLEISEKPELVRVNENLKGLIFKLEKCLNGAVAFISGRTILDVDQLFKPLELPMSGKHGAERRDASGQTYTARYHASSITNSIVKTVQKFVNDNPGTSLENKEQTLALHYRLKPQIEKQATDLINDLISNHTELELLNGKMVLEIKPKITHKGTAIAQFMKEYPFVGKTPYFFGDDTSDEDGFKIINSMNGISVCVNPPLNSAAKFKLDTVSSVINWLESLSAKLKESAYE